MTEKKQRFTIEIIGEKDVFIKEEGANYYLGINEYVNAGAICSLLNELNDENIRLKKERNHFERKKTEYLTEWNTCRIQNTELKKDNQELKEAMKRMMIEMMGG